MAENTKYTVARTDGVGTRDCTCSCSNSVTVYYSSGKEDKEQRSFSAQADTVQIKVLEIK